MSVVAFPTAVRRLALPAPRDPATLAVGAALWLATVCNWPLWRALSQLPEMHTPRGGLFIASLALMITSLCAAVLAMFAWRWSIKPAITLCLLAAAFGAYFMGTYGIVIDPTMMINVLGTDLHETGELLSPRLWAGVLLLAGVPLVWLWRTPLAPLGLGAQALRNAIVWVGGLSLVISLVVLSFADLSSTMRNHKSLRYMINPANTFWSLGRLAIRSQRVAPRRPPLAIATDARARALAPGAKAPLLVLMIGETARADHFSANGYARPTNAETAPLGVLSFRDVTSCGTNTAMSLPCMFSDLGRDAWFARTHEYENLLDVLQRAGLAVLWLDNQAGCKGVCERVPNASALQPPPGTQHASGLCHGDECLDEALLTGIDERLAALPAERRAKGVVIVMHQMGSHGPAYHKRAPPERKPFQPECATNVLQQCPSEQLINAYDNSIAYTDHVLARAIAWLGRQQAEHDTSLLYVSDHGESLGEGNLYLHGMPYSIAPREQKHVPMMLWLPPATATATGVATGCLRGLLDAPLTHDHLFHTVLGLVGVATSAYRATLDVLQPCRGS